MKKFAIALLMILSIIGVSCQIGLGAAVDTEPPKLAIENPPVDAIIRDNFALSGTWSDDGKIASITAKLTRTDGNGSEYEYTGTFTEALIKRGSGTWKIEVPVLEDAVIDGTYQAVVTIKDATDRVTTQSTTFNLDNTPPLVILQRPATDISTTDEDSIDTFGKIFTLEGRAADDNNIDHIDIKIYSDAAKTNLLDTVTLRNVPLSIALDAAKWGDDVYNKIYGTTVESKKRYYCSIEAYDAAQRYPMDGSDQTDADKNGNCTTDYYLYKEVANSSIADLKVTELYSVLNGTSSRAAIDPNNVKSVLNSLKKNTGTFFLNPLNNPTFKLASWKAKTDTDEGFIAFDNTSISFDVEPGLDSYPIDDSSLKVYFIEAEYEGLTPKVKEGAKKLYLSDDETNGVVKITGSSTYKVSVTIDRTKPVYDEEGNQLSDKLKFGSYIAVIEGKDSKDNELLPETIISGIDGYPINIASSTGAPELSVYYKLNGVTTTDSIIYMPKTSNGEADGPASVLTLSGTVKVSTSDPADKPSDFYVLIDGTKKTGISAGNLILTDEEGKYKFENINISFTGDSKQHTVIVVAENGAKGQENKSVMYDAEGPVIDIRSVTPIASTYKTDATVDETNFINGKITVSVSFADAFDVVDVETNKPKIEFIQGGQVKKSIEDIDSLSYTTVFDTTELTDNADVTMKITAYDRSGNKKENPVTYKVKQVTDKPVVFPNDKDKVTLEYSFDQINAKTGKNVFNLGTQFPIDLIDDDGLKTCILYITKDSTGAAEKPTAANENNEKEIIVKTLSGNKNTVFYDLPQEAGFYKVWLEVIDNVVPTTQYNKTELGPFFIQIASGQPVVTLKANEFVTTKTADSDVISTASKTPLKVEIKVDSTEGPFVIKRVLITPDNQDPSLSSATYIKNQAGEEIDKVTLSQGSSTITVYDYFDEISDSDDDKEYSIKYFVTDNNGGGNTGTNIIKFKLDKTKPTIKTPQFELSSTPENIDVNKWYQSDTIPLLVTANDGESVYKSGISTIEYTLDDGANWTALTPQQTAQSSTDELYKRNVTFAEGSNTLKIRAVDTVGNKTEITKTVKVDISAPEFSVADSQNMIYINKATANSPLVLTGEYKDKQSGVAELELKLGTQEAVIKYYAEAENAENPKNLENVTESDWKAYNEITDKASIKYWKAEFSTEKINTVFNKDENGKLLTKSSKLTISGQNLCIPAKTIPSASIPDITIMMDIDDPEFESISIKSANEKGVYQKSETEYYVSTVLGDTFTVSGIAKDDTSSVKSVTWSEAANTVESAGWSFPITFDTTDTEKTITLSITDKAGNTRTAAAISVKVDNLAPKAIHALDDKNKDLYFRIGDNNNDEREVAAASAPASPDYDDSVGGKYSENTYGNANTIKVRGRFDDPDSGSGVKMIYYKVVNADAALPYSDLKTQAENFLANYNKNNANGYTGYFAPLASDKLETKRVFYTASDDTGNEGKIFEKYISEDPDTHIKTIAKSATALVSSTNKILDPDDNTNTKYKYYTDITTNFSQVLSGFKAGINYLILVAEDNVGNTALDTVVVGNDGDPTLDSNPTSTTVHSGTYYNASLNVDTTPPTTTGTTGIKYTNADAESPDITISGTASDTQAGVYGLVINANGKTIKVGDSDTTNGTLTLNGKKGDKTRTWTAVIKAKVFAGASDPNQSITALVTDCAGAGNSQSVPVGTVIVDTLPPTVKLTAPADADSNTGGIQINGKISLSGTISDENVLPNVAITGLRYNTSSINLANNDSGWKDFRDLGGVTLTFSGNYTFTIGGVDTTKLSDGTYYIQAVGVDSAGNTGYSSGVEVKIAQDSDRPKLNITNLNYDDTLRKYILRYGTNSQVTGRISDDDSTSEKVVDTLIISDTEYTGTGTAPANRVIKFTASTGEFTYEPGDTEDGTKTFYIYIKDNGGNEFYTSATTADYLNNPKVLLNGTAQSETINKEVFTYLSDSKSPTPGDGKGLPYYEKTENNTTTKVIAKDDSDVDFDITKDNSSLNSNFVIGGSKRKFVKFYFTATDASGIAGMTLKISDMEATPTVKLRLKTAGSITGAPTEDSDPESLALYTLDVGTNKGTWEDTTSGSSPGKKWTTDYIDISNWATGQYSVEVKSYDLIGNAATDSKTFYVDNTAPAIAIGSPENGEEKTGIIKISGTTTETGKAGLDSKGIKWLIPTKAQITEAQSEESADEYFKNLDGWSDKLAAGKTVSAWQFDFDGATGSNPNFETYDKPEYATPTDGIYALPVYFMATDKLGNFTIKKDFKINHNPDGDKPKVSITYPTKENYDTGSTFATLGGTISVTGSAEIPSGTTTVKKVYLQIANNTGAFNATDKAKAGTGSGNYGFTVVDAYDVINAIRGTSYNKTATSGDNAMTDELAGGFGFANKAALDAWWGIEASNTASWRIQLNANGAMNPTGTNDTNDIKIRACAVNANGKFGAWTSGDGVVSIHIDNKVPVLSAVVKQYDSAITANPTTDPSAAASQNYSADMFLRGNNWYIVLDARDESGIDSVSVKKNGQTSVTCYEMSLSADADGKSGKRVYIPIDSTVTSVSYEVEATEVQAQGATSAHSTKATYSFKIDNRAPSLEDIKNGSEEALSDEENSKNQVRNSNSVYTIQGVSDDLEGGSGVEHVVFYYMRKAEITQPTIGEEVILDPMINPEKTTTNGVTTITYGAKVALGDLTPIDLGLGNNKPGLFAKSVSGAVSKDTNGSFNTFTTTTTLDDHIRVGGLVKIDGIYRKILTKNAANTEITFSPATTAESNVTALFPIAQVIDANNTAKQNSQNPFQFDTGKDDGDGMVESFSKSGSKWSWDASIHSDNMPDGPATLAILVFDSAGNVDGKLFKVMVSNNEPRLAKVFLATDLNKDGSYSDNEFETYNIAAATGNSNGEEAYELTTANFKKYSKNAKDEWVGEDSTRGSFTIKNKLAIVPEFVGGNGTIGLVFSNSDSRTTTTTEVTTVSVMTGNTGTATGKKGTLATSDANPRTITGDYWELTALGDDTKTASANATKNMSFTFWDSTDECTQGTNSQYTFLRVTDFIVDQVDDVIPNVVVNPFEWTDKDHNSLYQNSSANGHIELEADWTALDSDGTTKLTGWDGKGTAQNTYLDGDPKVSGKIVLRGTAYDDTLLGGLSFSMTNFDSSTTTPISVATYGTTGWTITKVGGNNPTMATNFYEVTVEDEYVNQNGHKANWTIAIDTAHLEGKACIDAVFTVIATDQKAGTANSSSSRAVNTTATDDAIKHKPSYTMDVVPYITDISTGDMDSGTKKYLRRSASGAYVASVDDATAVTVKGFNLNGGTVYVGTSSQSTSASGDNLTISKSSISKSGKIKVVQTVDSKAIESLNNVNNDKADYNKEPSEFAPNCTDKRYIYMWDTTTTTYSGTEAVMKPVIGTDGKKTGNMIWLYAQNNQYLYANNQQLTNSWAGAIYGGNFAYNSSGSPSWTFLHNMNWASGVSSYTAFGSVQWAKSFANMGKAVEWNRPKDNINYARLGLGNLSFNSNTQSYSYNQAIMKRYENIKMLVKGDNTDTLNMVAYFDKADESRSIVFWRFHEGTGITSKAFQQTNEDWWSGTQATYTDMSRIVDQTYAYNATQSRTSVGLDTPAGREEISTAKSSADSQYFDMAYDSVKDVVYIAYYDEANGGLKIKYLNNPAAGYYGHWTNSWSEAEPVDMDAAGQFVAMKTDASGNIHLAYYDSTGSYLKYARLEPTGNAGAVSGLSVKNKVLVDTLFTNGMYNSITLKEFEDEDGVTEVRPVICSYSISYGGTRYALRTSWPLTKMSELAAGATEDGYTGKWETVVVVSANAPTQNNTYVETDGTGTGYTGNIVVGYTASKLEQAKLLDE
jgi:hypothetical protein